MKTLRERSLESSKKNSRNAHAPHRIAAARMEGRGKTQSVCSCVYDFIRVLWQIITEALNQTMHLQLKKWRNAERSLIEKDWRQRGFSCELWVDPPGQCWENTIHDVDEVMTPLNAAIEIEWEGEDAILDPGDEWFIPRSTYHSVRNTSTETARWLFGHKRH